MKNFSMVVAIDEKGGIGKNGTLAWTLPPDLKHFKQVTSAISDPSKKNAVVMGRKTWDSLPEKFRPLPGRLNVVLSQNSSMSLPAGVLKCGSLDEAIGILNSNENVENIFVIGGGQIFTEAIHSPQCQKLHVTQLKGDFFCDAFFPPIPALYKKTEETSLQTEGAISYSFCVYLRLS